jgi:hypothetical protein
MTADIPHRLCAFPLDGNNVFQTGDVAKVIVIPFLLPENNDGFRDIDDLKKMGKFNIIRYFVILRTSASRFSIKFCGSIL